MLVRVGACALITTLAAQPPPPAEYVCKGAASPIVVDGKGDETAWKTAPPMEDFRLLRTFRPPTERTTVRFCYDAKNLYALFECADPDICVLNRGRDARIWESDCVELFLKPDAPNPIYYEFEVSPANDVFDARFVNTGSGGFQRWAAWNCAVETAVEVRGTVNDWRDKDEGYTVEIAVPLGAFQESIGDRPLAGQAWKFAAVRVDISVTLEEEERSATANVPEGNLHSKEGYFTLIFE